MRAHATPDPVHRSHRPGLQPDGVDLLALALFTAGTLILLLGTGLTPPQTWADGLRLQYPEWGPGLVTDGVLLWVMNRILRRHERRRVLSQVGSLSREFALDAVRRTRDEGWLVDGTLRDLRLTRANLPGADLEGADLRGVDLSFANLEGAILAHADLSGAVLCGANLRGADLRGTELARADLSWADLRMALLDGIRLGGARTRYASVDEGAAARPGFEHAVPGGFLEEDEAADVQRSFQELLALGPTAVELFYVRLFEAAPYLRPLFRTSPRDQTRKLLGSLKVIVSALREPHRHVGVLRRLGARHEGYGVRPEHYRVLETVLLEVLGELLGDGFTPRVHHAWERAYRLIAFVMTDGASEGSISPTGARAAEGLGPVRVLHGEHAMIES